MHHSTIAADVSDNPPKGGGKSATGSAATKKLIDGGMSQRQVAKLVGVHLRTVQRDLTQSASKSDAKSVTGSAANVSARTGSVATHQRPPRQSRRSRVAFDASSARFAS